MAFMSSHARLLALVSFTSVLAYADRIVLAIATPLLMQELHLSAAQIGLASTAFIVGYGIMSGPGGWFADRYSGRLALAVGVGLWSVCTVLTGFAQSLAFLLVCRFGLGVGEGVLPPAAAQIVSRWFSAARRARANSVWLAGMQIGMVVGAPLSAWIISLAGWRAVFWLLGLVGIVLAPILYRMIRDAPPLDHGGQPELVVEAPRDQTEVASLPHGQPPVARGRLALLCAGYFCVIMLWTANSSWLPYYLVKDRGLSIMSAGLFASLPYLAGAVAILLGGWLSDTVLGGKRALPSAIASLIGPLFVVLSLTTSDNMVSIAAFAIANGLAGIALSLYWTLPAELFPGRSVATSSGIMMTAGTIGAALVPVGMGFVADRTGSFFLAFLGVAAMTCLGSIITLAIARLETRLRHRA